jgi:hypothetical protein
MGVADGGWLAVWWPWLVVWVVAVLSLLAAPLITVRHWRRARRFTERHFRGSVVWYLDEQRVENFFGATPRPNSWKRPWRFSGQVRIFGITITITIGDQPASPVPGRYNDKKPSDIIARARSLIDDLDKLDKIVHVDLPNQEVDANQTLRKRKGAPDGKLPDSIRLVDISSWVSVYGLFRIVETTESDVIFQAPYGNPANSANAPNVRIRCDRNWLCDATVPEDPFRAHCLGRVQRWESGSGAGYLEVYPVVVFR